MDDRKGKLPVLIVDDNYGNRLSLEALLSPDYAVDLAASGHQALALALRNEYAVILLDVRMPLMDGFETATLLRKNRKTRDTAVIFTSAFDQNDAQVARGYEVGGTDYLFSPVDSDLLKLKLRTYVRMHERILTLRRDLDRLAALVGGMEGEITRSSASEQAMKARVHQLEDAIKNIRQGFAPTNPT